jgi:hypothetical protein
LSTFENVNWFNLLGVRVLSWELILAAGGTLAALNFKEWKIENIFSVDCVFIYRTIYFGYFNKFKHLFSILF